MGRKVLKSYKLIIEKIPSQLKGNEHLKLHVASNKKVYFFIGFFIYLICNVIVNLFSTILFSIFRLFSKYIILINYSLKRRWFLHI